MHVALAPSSVQFQSSELSVLDFTSHCYLIFFPFVKLDVGTEEVKSRHLRLIALPFALYILFTVCLQLQLQFTSTTEVVCITYCHIGAFRVRRIILLKLLEEPCKNKKTVHLY